MNIGIDCGAISISDLRLATGVYQLTINLLEELSKIDKVNQYWLYSFQPISKRILQKLGPNFQNKVLKPRLGWLSFRLSLELFLHKPDLFLGLNQALPLVVSCKKIIIVHDLAFEFYPDYYPGSYKKLHFLTRNAVRRANEIIVYSESTKKDLVNLYQIQKDKVKVIPLGIRPIYKRENITTIKSILNKYRLQKPYILFVGSLKPIKNINGILNAYENLPSDVKQKNQLVITGSDYWADHGLKQRMERMVKKKLLKYLGFVPDNDLPGLYGGVKVFLSTSFYEGFGLPLLEAMACGCPVIAGNKGSAPEVVGNAALLVNPHDIADITSKLNLLLTDLNLNHELKKKSLLQAKKFSLEKFGREVYNEISKI